MKIPFISNVHGTLWLDRPGSPKSYWRKPVTTRPSVWVSNFSPPGLKFLWVKFGAQISDPCVEINVYIDYNYNLRLLEMLCTGHIWTYLDISLLLWKILHKVSHKSWNNRMQLQMNLWDTKRITNTKITTKIFPIGRSIPFQQLAP